MNTIYPKYRHKPTGKLYERGVWETGYLFPAKELIFENDINVPFWLVRDSKDWEEVKEGKLTSCGDTDEDGNCPKCLKQPEICPKREEKKPEYTILALQSKDNCFNEEFGENGFSIFKNNRRFWIDYRLNILHWDIYSVSRESDGEIFTVSDSYIDQYGGKRKILGFVPYFKDSSKLRIAGGDRPNIFTDDLSTIKKIKEKLFTTEDGVDIYAGDNIYRLLGGWETFKDSVDTPIVADKIHKDWDELWFSTKEKAEWYILMNKNIFNVHDMLNVRTNGWYTNDILKLAKSRLK